MDDNSERRKFPRVSFREICHIEYVDEERREGLFHSSRDLSSRGLALEVEREFDTGRNIFVHIGASEEPIKIKGKVAYCRPVDDGRYLVGVEFQVISLKDSRRLEELLSE